MITMLQISKLVGQAILPAAVFQAALRRLKAPGNYDWLPHI